MAAFSEIPKPLKEKPKGQVLPCHYSYYNKVFPMVQAAWAMH